MIQTVQTLKTDLAFAGQNTSQLTSVKTGLLNDLKQYCEQGEPVTDEIREKIVAAILVDCDENGLPVLASLPLGAQWCKSVEEQYQAITEKVLLALLELLRQIIRETVSRSHSLAAKQGALDYVLKTLEVLNQEPKLSDNLKNTIRILAAQAYYRRAAFIQPRGFSYPSKKREALSKGIAHFESIDNPDNEAKKINGLLHLELADMGEPVPELCDILQNIVSGLQINNTTSPEEIRLALGYAECLEPGTNELLNLLFPLLEPDDTPQVSTIDRAWTGYYLQFDDEAKNFMKKAINALDKRRFSRQAWDKVRGLLVRLHKDHMDGWKDLAVHAWKVCSKSEQFSGSGPAIRWYWSRQGDIYDLAFQAFEGDPAKQARVVDSLKARPALHLQAGGPEMVKADALIRANQYMVENIPVLDNTNREEPTWKDTPGGCIVVHLYLGGTSLKNKGYALINNPWNGSNPWVQKEISKVDELKEKFWSWQENYQLGKRNAAPFLETLCLQLGDSMDFLFDPNLFPECVPVVFVPHDFFHRLPLHCAMWDNENGKRKIWCLNRPVYFLPAWWMADSIGAAPNTDSCIVLNNWESDTFDDFSAEVQNRFPGNLALKPATGKHLAELTASPAQLYLFCHGKAHMENPYQACLKLAEGGITNQEIRMADQNKLDLTGARILLGACETDLAPPLSTMVDEHLSLASAFLDKGAAEIVGTMWEVDSRKVKNLALTLFDNGSSHANDWASILHEWQTTKLQNYLDNNHENGYDSKLLYDYAAFRCYGLPATSKSAGGDD